MLTNAAAQQLTKLKSLFRVLRDERGLLQHWERLVTTLGVQGKSAHDARLVAAMRRHNLKHIYTFNAGDFRRYPGITVVAPGGT